MSDVEKAAWRARVAETFERNGGAAEFGRASVRGWCWPRGAVVIKPLTAAERGKRVADCLERRGGVAKFGRGSVGKVGGGREAVIIKPLRAAACGDGGSGGGGGISKTTLCLGPLVGIFVGSILHRLIKI